MSLWLNFLGSFMTSPGFQLLGALKGRAITWDWMSSSRSGNGWIQWTLSRGNVLCVGSCGGSLGSTGPPGQAGPSHHLGRGTDRGECCESLDLGSNSQAPAWGCAWGCGSLLRKAHLFLWGWSREERFLTYSKHQSPGSRKEISSI